MNDFQTLLYKKAKDLYRDMPWRDDTRPYYVLVSELMLQQTQVVRVIPKFEAFVARFPDEDALASASLADVVKHWQGLGYNMRAKYLHEAARLIVEHGAFPDTDEGLQRLPGVGQNTAGAIRAYSYNQASIFVETNIRTVYIHHFLNDHDIVTDAEIRELLEQTIDRQHPREFYWSLMDYGAWLKRSGVATHIKSRQYRKQAPLAGSMRQVRGQIIAALSHHEALSYDRLADIVKADDRFPGALDSLEHDGLIRIAKHQIHLTK